MRDNGTPTTITTGAGTPIYIADKPCTRCGCFEAFVFECGCGAVHSDVCYNCGGYVDMQHEPLKDGGDGWTKRCTAGAVEHRHENF